MYYLQSRYYNPTWGRFLNADVLVSTGQGILGNNMFAYCRNNPVKRIDITGTADLCVTDGEDDNPFNDLGTIGRGSIAGNSNSGSFGNANCGVNTTGGANQNVANGSVPNVANGGSNAGYSYSVPRGGGGVSAQVQVGDITVTFGHGGRHMDFSDISGLENAIAHDVVSKPPLPNSFNESNITYNGSNFTYRYFVRDPALIHVGTYFYTRGN